MPTVVTSTIGSGQDYATPQAAIDAADNDLVVADKQYDLVLKEGFSGANAAANFAGFTADATRFVRMQSDVGARQSLTASDNATSLIIMSSTYTELVRVQAGGTGNGGSNKYAVQLTAQNCKVDQSLIQSAGIRGGESGMTITQPNCTVSNSIFNGFSTSGARGINCQISGSNNTDIENIILHDCDTNIFTSTTAPKLSNVQSTDAGTAQYSGTFGTSSHNTSSGTDTPGTNNLNSVASSTLYTNAGAGDFTTKAGSGGIDSGTDTGNTESYSGIVRPQNGTYDRGAYEVEASGGGGPLVGRSRLTALVGGKLA